MTDTIETYSVSMEYEGDDGRGPRYSYMLLQNGSKVAGPFDRMLDLNEHYKQLLGDTALIGIDSWLLPPKPQVHHCKRCGWNLSTYSNEELQLRFKRHMEERHPDYSSPAGKVRYAKAQERRERRATKRRGVTEQPPMELSETELAQRIFQPDE